MDQKQIEETVRKLVQEKITEMKLRGLESATGGISRQTWSNWGNTNIKRFPPAGTVAAMAGDVLPEFSLKIKLLVAEWHFQEIERLFARERESVRALLQKEFE